MWFFLTERRKWNLFELVVERTQHMLCPTKLIIQQNENCWRVQKALCRRQVMPSTIYNRSARRKRVSLYLFPNKWMCIFPPSPHGPGVLSLSSVGCPLPIFRALSSILPSSDSIFQLDLSDCLLTSEGLQVIIEVRSRIRVQIPYHAF